jgi:hypothetical protein
MIRRLHSLATDLESAPLSKSDVTAEVKARLAALGYIDTPRAPETRDRSPLPDPKDCIPDTGPGSERQTVEDCLTARR